MTHDMQHKGGGEYSLKISGPSSDSYHMTNEMPHLSKGRFHLGTEMVIYHSLNLSCSVIKTNWSFMYNHGKRIKPDSSLLCEASIVFLFTGRLNDLSDLLTLLSHHVEVLGRLDVLFLQANAHLTQMPTPAGCYAS